MNKVYDTIVIGGGPAGMFSAGFSMNTLLIEKNSFLGKKLNITGKGRCNLTKNEDMKTFISKFGKNGKFLYQAFSRFFNTELVNFFEKRGVKISLERGGRFFPTSSVAKDITDALKDWLKEKKVEVKCDVAMSGFILKEGKIIGVKTNKGDFFAKNFILATGGKTYPGTGSTGDGFKFLKTLGHNVKDLKPSLTPLISKEDFSSVSGVSLKNVNLTVFIDNKKKESFFGEMLFTHFGVSGPIVLTLSDLVVDAIDNKKQVYLSLDFKPALTEEVLDKRLIREINDSSKKKIKFLILKLLPKNLVPFFISRLDIEEEKTLNEISKKERKQILYTLKNFKIEIVDYKGFDDAIITKGGVSLKEVDPYTMRSTIYDNLYFAGEILDLNGLTGGYNLQESFSTGYLAGISTKSNLKS